MDIDEFTKVNRIQLEVAEHMVHMLVALKSTIGLILALQAVTLIAVALVMIVTLTG